MAWHKAHIGLCGLRMTDYMNWTADGAHCDWPTTVAMTRYGGGYEGNKWAAWEATPDEIPPAAFGGDEEAGFYWESGAVGTVGRGATPDLAIADLRRRQSLHEATLRREATQPKGRNRLGAER